MLPSWVNWPISDIRAYLPNSHYVDFVRCLWGISYPKELQWAIRITKKKLQAQFHPEDPFLVVTLMPKYGQKSTFDKKVLQTPFFY